MLQRRGQEHLRTVWRVTSCVFYRRAAHFAHFQADDEETAQNAHTGGSEVISKLKTFAGPVRPTKWK